MRRLSTASLYLLAASAFGACGASEDDGNESADAAVVTGANPSLDGGTSSRANDAARAESEGGGRTETDGGRSNDAGALDASTTRDASTRDAGNASDGGSRTSDASVTDASSDAASSSDAARDGSTCPAPAAGSRGTNPLFSDQFSADPGAFVHDCTFYIQCGHDEAASGQKAFVMREWFLLSSQDMVHWTKTVALRLSDFKWANANAWAGQMVTKGGKFYWYVPVQEASTGAMAIGVAVADSPTGPFKDALGKPLINDAFEMSNVGYANPSATPFTIDPTVFVDDDGRGYMHYGGFGHMMVVELNDDMISVRGKMRDVTPQGFFEAPFLIKRGGVYYEIYAAGQNPATIDYATASSPLGPWTRKGRILDAFSAGTGEDAPTNHAGVAQLAGQWYLVYHLSKGPNGGGTYRREVAVDKLSFAADGAIEKVMPSMGLSF